MLADPYGDLLTLICSELNPLPPPQLSVGLSVLTTWLPDGDDGVGATTDACVAKNALPLCAHVPAPLPPEHAVTSQR